MRIVLMQSWVNSDAAVEKGKLCLYLLLSIWQVTWFHLRFRQAWQNNLRVFHCGFGWLDLQCLKWITTSAFGSTVLGPLHTPFVARMNSDAKATDGIGWYLRRRPFSFSALGAVLCPLQTNEPRQTVSFNFDLMVQISRKSYTSHARRVYLVKQRNFLYRHDATCALPDWQSTAIMVLVRALRLPDCNRHQICRTYSMSADASSQ